MANKKCEITRTYPEVVQELINAIKFEQKIKNNLKIAQEQVYKLCSEKHKIECIYWKEVKKREDSLNGV